MPKKKAIDLILGGLHSPDLFGVPAGQQVDRSGKPIPKKKKPKKKVK
jgi:hypothetical protein